MYRYIAYILFITFHFQLPTFSSYYSQLESLIICQAHVFI
jgi:hypothetical protein